MKSTSLALFLATTAALTAQEGRKGTGSALAGELEVAWKLELQSLSFGGAAVADADGDGKLEVAFCTYFGDSHVRVLNGEDGSLLWQYDAGGGKGAACLDASLRFCDVNGDGDLDLVVPVSNGCEVHAFDSKTGDQLWTYETGSGDCIDSPPAIADADGDGDLDVVFGSFKKRLHVVDGKTGDRVRVLSVGDGFVQTGPVVIDVDGDGVKDYLAGTFKGDNRLYARSGKDGEELWHLQVGEGIGIYHGPAVADLDGDGELEVIQSAYDGVVHCVALKSGEVQWRAAPGDRYFMAPVAVGDVTGDGKLEVVAVSQRATVIRHDGEVLYSVPLAPPNSWAGSHRGASLADLDGDGGLDIAYLVDDGTFGVLRGKDGVKIYELDCRKLTDKPLQGSDHGVALADFTGDGRLDAFLVVGTAAQGQRHGLALCLTGFRGEGEGWYMLRHDAQNTGAVRTQLAPALRRSLAR